MFYVDQRQRADTMSDWVTVSIQGIVSKVNKAERASFLFVMSSDDQGTEPDLQVTRCDGMSGTGFSLQIPGRITILPVNLGTEDLGRGGFKVTLMRNGNLLVQVLSCGLMENVSILHPCSLPELTITASAAGAGKSVIWYDNLQI
jgi:hypothetical protein